MPVGAKAHIPDIKTDLNFKEFYETNGKFFFAALEIPYEIALMIFTQSFSSSRAAAKIWDKILAVKSRPIRKNFYEPYYQLLLEIAVRRGLLRAPGLVLAYAENTTDIIEAWANMRLIPTRMPHIDPEKEARAERIKGRLGWRRQGANQPRPRHRKPGRRRLCRKYRKIQRRSEAGGK